MQTNDALRATADSLRTGYRMLHCETCCRLCSCSRFAWALPMRRQDQRQGGAGNRPGRDDSAQQDGRYLRTLKAFRVLATTTTEDVLDDGRKIQFAATADLLAQRPDRLRLDVDGDRQDRAYYFNGKAFTLWAERTKFYAAVSAQSTIAETLNRLEAKYDIELPFADLFRWGEPGSSERSITAALSLGLSDIDGTSCTHYAFRQPELDWQVWIQNGDSLSPGSSSSPPERRGASPGWVQRFTPGTWRPRTATLRSPSPRRRVAIKSARSEAGQGGEKNRRGLTMTHLSQTDFSLSSPSCCATPRASAPAAPVATSTGAAAGAPAGDTSANRDTSGKPQHQR